MNLLEYEAKQILATAGIPVPNSVLLRGNEPISKPFPVVIKSQVPTGGRGKAGGIKVVDAPDQAESLVQTLFGLEIKGHKPNSLLVEDKVTIKRELYLSLMIDRQTAGLKLMAHTNGGIEVEDNSDFVSWQVKYQKPDFDALGQALADYYDLQDQAFALQDLVQNLHSCLKQNDATLIEINPLILSANDQLIAGDAKMTLDDAASFRHPEWQFEAAVAEANFVTINQNGTVATIANGAGLAMATVDAAYSAGLTPANFLDIGGGATTETLLKAFHKIMTEYPNLQAILINVFAGITRADEVAAAIIAAKKQIRGLPPLFIRIAGTNYQQAVDLLTAENISIMPNLDACLQSAKGVVDG
ncbi:MAG: ATP-grasp domain-containing protein [Candidatus Microsaccharimonas sp.]